MKEVVSGITRKRHSSASWRHEELLGSEFKDKRLTKRFRLLVKKLWQHLGDPLPLACQDWSNTKAAYRFFSNERVTEDQILNSHFQSTRQRSIGMRCDGKLKRFTKF